MAANTVISIGGFDDEKEEIDKKLSEMTHRTSESINPKICFLKELNIILKNDGL